jgi:hypothetical protein
MTRDHIRRLRVRINADVETKLLALAETETQPFKAGTVGGVRLAAIALWAGFVKPAGVG